MSADAQSKRGWTRLILEKPFGFDSESSARINQGLLRGLDENQIYRSDMWQPASIRHLVTILSLGTHTEMLASISGISLLVWDCLLAFLQMGC